MISRVLPFCLRSSERCFSRLCFMTSRSANSSAGKDSAEVKHLPEQKKFVLNIEESKAPAVIEYDFVTDGVIDLYHTEVPLEFQGKGIAKVLAAGAFEHVKKEKLRMKLSCWYLRGYLERNPNPDYEELVVED